MRYARIHPRSDSSHFSRHRIDPIDDPLARQPSIYGRSRPAYPLAQRLHGFPACLPATPLFTGASGLPAGKCPMDKGCRGDRAETPKRRGVQADGSFRSAAAGGLMPAPYGRQRFRLGNAAFRQNKNAGECRHFCAPGLELDAEDARKITPPTSAHCGRCASTANLHPGFPDARTSARYGTCARGAAS